MTEIGLDILDDSVCLNYPQVEINMTNPLPLKFKTGIWLISSELGLIHDTCMTTTMAASKHRHMCIASAWA